MSVRPTLRSAARSSVAAQFRITRLALALIVLLIPQLAAAQNTPVQPRITAQIDEGRLATLRGNTHPLARAQNDQGPAADSQPIRRMLLLLQRSAGQEAALGKLLDDQQNSSSPGFHQWLTAAQFGQEFGPADADVQTVTDWLESHGFQVARVSAGKTVIEFSGSAGQVREAFHTQIHRYAVDGRQWLANASDPQIPAALADVVAGPVSLHNFPAPQLTHTAGAFRKNKSTGEVTPLFSFTSGSCAPCNAMGPGDFAAIYNIQKLWNPPSGAPIDGTGQTVAVVGDSEICTANSPVFVSLCKGVDDVATFRNLFGLVAKPPNVILDGPDPGLDPGGSETEGDLDVEWSGAIARNATIDFVIAENTEASYGFDLASEYVVDNNLAPILSSSFGVCEGDLGTNGNLFEYALWEQAAAQGITVVVAAGDSGSANCDNRNLSSPNAAQDGTFVSGVASTPFDVAVGGTDFDFGLANYQSTYWNGGNTTVNGINGVSATQYVPETTWNDSCAQSFSGSVTGCISPPNASSVNILAGSGGLSACAVQNPDTHVCYGYWPKPAWQAVASGSGLTVTNDIARDLPDVSLFSAYGPITNTFYIVCEADELQAPCSIVGSHFDFLGVAGTSAAAPSFSGIAALVNQNVAMNQIPARQGNANYVLYHLAANQNGLNCNSSATPNPGCTFNDVTKGNNSVPCVGGSPSCSNTLQDGAYGILETVYSNGAPTGTVAFNAGTGFDLATGLGSVNAFNLVNNWPAAVGTFTPTATTLCLSTIPTTLAACVPGPITIQYGQPILVYSSVNATGSPTPISASWTNTKPEDISLIGTFAGGAIAGANAFAATNGVVSNTDTFQLTSGTVSGATAGSLIGGTYNVTARYAGDGTYGASTSSQPGIPVTVTSVPATVSILINPDFGPCCTTGSNYGITNIVRVDVCGPSVATCAAGDTSGEINPPSGTVVLTDNGGPIVDANGNPAGIFTLNGQGYFEYETPFFATGTHNFAAAYNGDATYKAASASRAFPLTVAPALVSVSVNPDLAYVVPGSSVDLTATLTTSSYASAIAGTVTFFSQPSNCPPSCAKTQLGTVNLVPVAGQGGTVAAQTATPFIVTPAASESIWATFNPAGANPDYASSSNSSTLEVGYPNFTLGAPTDNPVTFAPGGFALDSVSLQGTYGFTGTIAMTCGVTPANLSDPPTCGISSSVNLSPQQYSVYADVNIQTTAAGSGIAPTIRITHFDWFLLDEVTAMIIGCCYLMSITTRRRRGIAFLAILLGTTVVAAAGGCGKSGGGGSGGNSVVNSPPLDPGTAAGTYTVTVTATPPSGAAQQQTITLIVQ